MIIALFFSPILYCICSLLCGEDQSPHCARGERDKIISFSLLVCHSAINRKRKNKRQYTRSSRSIDWSLDWEWMNEGSVLVSTLYTTYPPPATSNDDCRVFCCSLIVIASSFAPQVVVTGWCQSSEAGSAVVFISIRFRFSHSPSDSSSIVQLNGLTAEEWDRQRDWHASQCSGGTRMTKFVVLFVVVLLLLPLACLLLLDEGH